MFEKELKRIARDAGSLFTSRRLWEVDRKEGHANFVTNIDREVEDFLQSRLLRLVPGSVMIGEEQENEALSDAPTWIVDPVDGTTNLIHGCRFSAVSIALCTERKPRAALIWQPYTGEMFYAEKGRGASLNDRPIHTAETPFPEALVAFGTAPYYTDLAADTMRLAAAFLHACADLRRSGSAALDLAYLACGRHDVFFELSLKPWDYAAGTLLVQEAGGVVDMPLEPNGICFGKTAALFAAGPACGREARELFDRVLREGRKG